VRSVPPRVIGSAVDLIDGAAEAVSVAAGIARAANLSARALETGFGTNLGMAPMTYLRKTRRARVCEELRSADLEQISASTVLRRWGFNHYSRFGLAYRKRYGVSPGVTLRTIPDANVYQQHGRGTDDHPGGSRSSLRTFAVIPDARYPTR
jgi:AraC-like DNA-binding protein